MIYAVILLAGIGSRMQNALPKQFIEINNKPLFIYTLEKFINIKKIDEIYLVINSNYTSLYQKFLTDYSYANKVKLIIGGSTRQESVFNAVTTIKAQPNDILLIHDGARPLVSEKIILENLNLCQEKKTVISTIINIVDTLIDKTYNLFNKSNFLLVQTPQTFLYQTLYTIHQKAKQDKLINVSDDAQLAKRYGYKINYVKGSRNNIKITESEDIELFKALEKVGEN